MLEGQLGQLCVERLLIESENEVTLPEATQLVEEEPDLTMLFALAGL